MSMQNIKSGQSTVTFPAPENLNNLSSKANRLGNKAIKEYSNVNSVKDAVQLISADQLHNILKSTGLALNGKSNVVPNDKKYAPQLIIPEELSGAPPAPDAALAPAEPPTPAEAPAATSAPTADKAEKMTSDVQAESIRLLGEVEQLMNDSSLQNIISKLKDFNTQFASMKSSTSELATEIEKLSKDFASDSDALKAANSQAKLLQLDVTAKQKASDGAKTTLAGLKSKAAQQNPVPDALQNQIDTAQTAVTATQQKLADAQLAYQNYVTITLNPAIAAEQKSSSALNVTMDKAETLLNSIPFQQMSNIENSRKVSDCNAKSLTFLMALMSELINKNSDENLQASAELNKKLSEAAAKDATKKAKEYEDQIAKSEELNKALGCAGKILGWLIVAVSCISAIFSGGASLAFAAVGLALAIGDEIDQAVTGESFMQQAMQPIMDNVIKPMMDKLGSLFTDILESAGVDKETAEKVGKILGAVVAGVVLIAGMIVAGKVLSKVFGAVMKKLGTDIAETVTESVAKDVVKDLTDEVVASATKEVAKDASKKMSENVTKKLLNSVLGQAVKKVGGGLGKATGMSESKIAQVSTRTQMAAAAGEIVNSAIQVGGGIAVADMRVQAEKAKAQMENDLALQDLLNTILNTAIDSLTHTMATTNSILQNMVAAAENHKQAGDFITKNMSHTFA